MTHYFLENEEKQDPASIALASNEATSYVENKMMGRTGMIKRANAYVCISNRFYRMLDLCNYLPPATSYSAFLRAYEVKESKFIFPYEFLTDVELLQQNHLPPYPSNAWHSTLKQVDLLQQEYDDWIINGSRGEAPLNGLQKYEVIQAKWDREGWENMADYLKYYNSCDTGPMVQGVEKLMQSYIEQEIDIWKECLSTPGVSRILLMRGPQKEDVLFPLIDENDKDLYYLFRSQICAGPSLVFTRDLHINQTPLSPDSDEICKAILGYDCASLYLGQMLHPMPSQNYVRRFRSEKFRARFKRRYCMMYIWLQLKARQENVYIRTKQNQGYECKVGKYYVDGLSSKNGQVTVFEYLGCYFHGHSCSLNKRPKSESAKFFQATKEREAWFIRHNYKYVSCWECDMLEILAANEDLKSRYKSMIPSFFNSHRGAVSESQILNAVKSGLLFGFLLVTIETPEHLINMYERFPPIFANHDVTIDDVGKSSVDFYILTV